MASFGGSRCLRIARVACLAAAAMALPRGSEASDPLAASRRLREREGSLAPLLDSTTGITRDIGPIAVIEHDGTDYSRLEPDGTPNYAARARVTRAFYEDHGDLYDFVVVFTNFEFDTAGAVGFHSLVRNDVAGIGLPPVNNGPLFGSPGRLKGYIDMGSIGQYRLPPFSIQPGAPGFGDAVDVASHEIAHQWLARIRYRTPGGSDSTDLLGLDQAHWSYLLDSDASLLYGSDWVPSGAGVFRAQRVRQCYSSLDLYLMGLLDPVRVAPFTLLRNPSVSPYQLPQEGATLSATAETIDIAQIVAAETPRQPDHRTSQKDFRVGFIVLASPGADPTTEDLDAVNRLREAFSERFFALTRGVAFADTTLAEEPLPPPGPPADLDRALAWVRTKQALDGRWEDSTGTAVRDTGAALAALDAAATTGGAYERGQIWLDGTPADNLDFVARRARARALETLPATVRSDLIATILAHRNEDGGFGAARGYESDGFDTALALSALHSLGAPADARVRAALTALATLQEPEGGWALVPGRGPSTMATAEVLLAAHDWSGLAEAAVLLPPGIATLTSRQNADGGFGESPSTAHVTALALLALDRAGAPASVVDPATEWLQRTQLAEGSWNGRTYETALAIAALKGRTAPNLVVRQDDLTLDPAEPEEGMVVRARARVRNVGRLASPPAMVRLYEGAPAAAGTVDEVPLPGLEPEEDALVTLEFDTAGRPGTHLLSVKADADDVVSEVREDDNTASRSLEVEGPMADLAIRTSDIVVTPYPPEAGETVQVVVTVTNRGDREAPPTQLRLFRGHLGGGGAEIGQAVLPAMDAGASLAAAFDWLAGGPPASTHLVAVADAVFALAESDETNNQASLPVTITDPVGPGPDLEIPLVEVEPAVLGQLPQTISVRIVVRNLGRDPAASTVALFDGAPASGPLVVEQPIALAPRSAALLVIPFEASTPGTRTLTAVADRAALVEETDEGNNQAFAVVTDPGNTLDVAVASVAPSSLDVMIGETLTVGATVRNRGTMPIAQVPVILAHASGALGELDRELVTLAPGASTAVTLAWTTSFTGDAVPLAVVADPFDLLLEADEANNRQDFTVRVRASALTNLHVTGADITFEPDPPLEGGSAAVRIRIANPSPVDAGPFTVRFFLGDPGTGGALLGEASVPGVGGGSVAVAEIDWSPVHVQGTQGVFVVVDAAGQVEEYDETDNVGFRPFQVVGLPDLTLSSADLTLTPPFPRAGEDVTIRAVVRNLGSRPSEAAVLRVLEGEPAGGVLIGAESIPALAPGQSAPVTLTWTPATAGERLLSAVADADDVVVESDEGNNLGRRSVVVQDADLYTTAPFFSPDGDGIQDDTTLAYRATGPVDILVSDSRGHLVRTLAQNAPAEGAVPWDGRDDRGRLLWDGLYAMTLRSQTGVTLGRLDVVLDTNRSPIHDAAGTGLVALRTIDASDSNARGPAWMPSEDEVLLIIPADNPPAGFMRGLMRWRLDGARTYVSADAWYDPAVRFASEDAVSPDGGEVLLTKGGQVLAVDLLSGVRRPLGPGNVATWSPDGGRILIGNEVFARDGTALATLPFAGQWSPDGEDLISGIDIIHRDGTDPRQVPLPVEIDYEETLGAPCSVSSFWRGDRRIVLYIGRWTLQDNGGGGGTPQGEGGIVITCRDSYWLFTHDLVSGETRELLPFRDSPVTRQWSPDGSRLFHPSRSGDGAQEVTRETGGPGLQLWPSSAWVTPRSRSAYFCDAGPVGCSPYVARLSVITNLRNLTADLTPTLLPANNGILLKGTASDAHLDRWQLDYAASSSATTWHPIGAASSAPVVDGILATWVPSQPGTYLVRLMAWDRAGGQRTVSRLVAWSQTPALANITQTERLISPNDDGFKDSVRFDFLVQEPTRLEARVNGPEPPAGTPGQPPDVRRFSIDLPAIGPSALVWDGRDESGQLVADGRYTAFLNEVPFPVDVDASPPEIALRHDNLRLVDTESIASPGEILEPTGECATTSVTVARARVDRNWHVVDPNLKHWTHGIEWGMGPIYEPERDAQGQIVYVGGVPQVWRIDGRPVDVTKLVDPLAPATLAAEDFAGNASSVASAPVPAKLFVVGVRPMPRCVPAGTPLPPTWQIDDGRVKVPLRARFFVRGAPEGVGLKRFEYRATATSPWSLGPASSLPYDDMVDVDLQSLGLTPGSEYFGRFVRLGTTPLVSEEFRFRLCAEAANLQLEPPEPIPGTNNSRYTVNLETDVSEPLSSASLVVTGVGALQGFTLQVPFERIGPTSYRKVVVAPTAGCSQAGVQSLLRFAAVVRDASGNPLSHDGMCLNLRAEAGLCAHNLNITEEPLECSAASPDRVVLRVRAQSPDPAAVASVFRDASSPAPVGEPFAIGTDHPCGSIAGPSGPIPLYCNDRLLVADVVGVPEGPVPFVGRLDSQPPGEPLATSDREARVDRTAPIATVSEPPEGGVACVEADGQVENVRLVLRVDDVAPSVAVTGVAYRYGDGPWQPMCLDGDCEPWDDLETGTDIATKWDVRGLVDGAYELRFEVCDRSGNRTVFTRRLSITRAGTAIDLLSVSNEDFSPNGDGQADETRLRFRLPQTLRLEVTVRSGTAAGAIVRRLADQQFPAGTHEFVWDGRGDAGALATDGRYFVVAKGTNSCGGTDTTAAAVHLDITPPTAEISSPSSGAVVLVNTDVMGRATDLRFESYALSFGVGPSPTAWTSIATGAGPVGVGDVPGLLGVFQPPPTEGIYTLRLVARDLARNETQVLSLVNVGPRAFLERFTVAPRVFSPNGDGQADTAAIEYELLIAGRVTLEVRDAGGGLLRRLESAVDHTPGTYSVLWDGRLTNGALAPEGAHVVFVHVADPAGVAPPQEQALSLALDVSPPSVSIAQPVADGFVAPDRFVRGTVTDERLVEYVVSAEQPFHPPVELARGTQNQIDTDLAALEPLADGPYHLVVTAGDAGENRTLVRVPFTLDAILPQALIQSPLPGSTLERGSVPVAVTGSALDAHIDRYELSFGPGSSPSYYVPIATGTQAVSSGALGSWAVAGLADGAYVLKLVVDDLAGRSAESRSAVVLDGQAPDAAITVPTADAYLNASSTVQGTASDANLESWRLEAAPGEASTAFQWSLMAEGTSVVAGTLAEWAPLPPDGRHTLRLTVADRVGHESTVTRTITVDTLPPGMPGNVTTVVQPSGPTADIALSWVPNPEPDLAGYLLTRNGVAVTSGLLVESAFTDGHLPEGAYTYRLIAVDRAGNASTPRLHQVLVDLTPPTVALLQPAAGARVSGSIDVRGTAFSLDDFAEFRLLAGEGSSPTAWAPIHSSTLPVSAGFLGTWTPGQPGPHVLALEAEDRSGNQARVTAAVIVDHTPPAAPVLTAVANVPVPTSLTATWELSAEPDVIGYLAYRNGHIANAPGIVIGNLQPYLVPGPSYVDAELPDGAHCYRILAMDEAGNLSPPSNEICRSLDNQPPHAVLVEPPDGTRFDFPLRLLAVTPDLDVAFVRFDVAPAAQSSWTPIGPPDPLPPYEATLDPQTLIPGDYRVRAVAMEGDGEVDPSPSPITVTYGDATAPSPPAGLARTVDGAAVTLAWTAGPEPDLAGYHVYRDGEQLTPVPQATTSFGEAAALGAYEYGVTAVDNDGNESLPSSVEVHVYRLALDGVAPPVTEGPVALTGRGSHSAAGTVEIVRDGEVVGQAPAGPLGAFSVEGVTLVPGPNLFVARERSPSGDLSVPSDEVVVIANTAPGPISGLEADVSGLEVTLTWDASSDPEVFGYHVRRNGEDRTILAPQVDAFQITASSSLDGYPPEGAFDGHFESAWIPEIPGESSWRITFPQPALVARVDLSFAGTEGPVPALAHRIEADWEGRWLPLLDAPAGVQSLASHTLALAFATTRLQVTLAPASYVGLAEVSVSKQDIVPVGTPTYSETAPDGSHAYEVAAIDRYGARGPSASVPAVVGDVEPPPVPSGLQASVSGSDVSLTWQPVSAPDLAGYVVLRDGIGVALPTTPFYVDASRPNGTYSYTVRSRDAVGNQSPDSASASAIVFVTVPSPPFLAAAMPPTGGVLLSWTHPGGAGFALYRATIAGGPYALAAQTGDVRDYADVDVRPGATHFYVLRALDAAGNASAASNEVEATPLAPTPAILRPTDADHAITLRASAAAIGGRAWPGAVVALTVNDELRGVAEAGRAYDEVESLVIPPDVVDVRISPEGRTLAWRPGDGEGAPASWVEWATGVTSPLAGTSIPEAFSPDGRRLAYAVVLCATPEDCQTDLRYVDLESLLVADLEQGPISVGGTAWSPSGDRVAVTTWDPVAQQHHLAVIEVDTGLMTVLADDEHGFANLRWSPSGEEIAVLRWDDAEQRLEIDVIPAAGGPALSLPDSADGTAHVWMPAGRTIVYTSRAGDLPRLRSWELGTGALTDITDGTLSASDGRVDAAGQRVSYVRSDETVWPFTYALVVRDLSTGVPRDVLNWTSEDTNYWALHEWLRGGYLAFHLGARVRLFPSFDGAFHVPPVDLDPGVNLIEAEGIELSTGAISAASIPISVTVPSEVFPDLGIATADLASYPTVPLAGQATVVSGRVRNLGQASVAGALVNMSIRGPEGVLVEQVAELGTIAPGGSTLVSTHWTPPAAGTYLLRVEADPDELIGESREDNNVAAAGIFVVDASGLSVQVAADRSSYPAHTTALLEVDVTNGGAPFSGTLHTRVLTSAGAAVATIDERPIGIGYGHTQRVNLAWNTGGTLAGEYAFEVRLLQGDDVQAQASRAFGIDPDIAVWMRVMPADPTVPLGGSAVLNVRVENRGANTLLSDADVLVRIAPASGGDPAFVASAGLPTLGPGAGWDGTFTWSPAAPAGAFVVEAEVASDTGGLLASGEAPLEVWTPPGHEFTGTLTLAPSHVLGGVASRATASITNAGPTTIVGHPFALDVTNGASAAVLVSLPFSLDIPAGETREAVLDVPTDSLPPGSYLVFLRSSGSFASLDREALHVHSVITPPSIDSPPEGGHVPTAHPTLRVNNAFSPGGAVLEYEFELFRDEALTLPLPGAFGVPETPNLTSWTVQVLLAENERYFWRARATDGFSNSAWTQVASFRVDVTNEPPTPPTPDTPAPGAQVATLQPVLIVANAFDPELDPLTYDFRVAADAGMTQMVASAAGLPEGPLRTAWQVPVALIENAHYHWSARAHDANGSSAWTVPIAFQVDVENGSPSSPELLRPEQDEEVPTQTPELVVGPASDPEADVLIYRIEVDRVPAFDSPHKQVSPNLVLTDGEAAWTPPIPLADNAHAYWRGSAHDGQTSGPWSDRRFFVNLANDAPGAPVPLEPGAGTIVSTQTPTLRVQNAIDLDHDELTYTFEVRDTTGALVASASSVPQTPGQTSWQVTPPLTENGEFAWRARAHDGEAHGDWSSEIPFRVNSTNDPPTAPTLVAPPEGAVVAIPRPELIVANATSPDLLPLSYTFEVYRLESGGGSTLVASAQGVPPGAANTSWTPDQDLVNAGHSWRARAADVNQPGAWMPSAHFTVAVDTAPAPPTGLSAVAGDARVDLAWIASPEPDVSGYRVYRGVSPGGPYDFVAPTTIASFADTGLANGQTVYYVVTAIDAAFESDPSLEVAATPMAAPLAAEVAFWPAVVDGECLPCPQSPWDRDEARSGIGPLTPVLECVRDDGAAGVTAFFGFDNPTAAPAALPIGPENFFDPPPADRGQPSWFARGRSPEYPGVFRVVLDGEPLSWWLDGRSATADLSLAVKDCPMPLLACPEWLFATIEPPLGHDPASIDPASVLLGGIVPADLAYQALVDLDADGRMERKVRFAQTDVRPLLSPGSVALTVTGGLGSQTFAGGGAIRVPDPKARLQAWPNVLSQSQPGPDVQAWLTLRGCFGGAGIDVQSVRLNGKVPVARVIGIEGGVLKLAFSRASVIAVLPLGDSVELILTGVAQGQTFRAVDLIQVVE